MDQRTTPASGQRRLLPSLPREVRSACRAAVSAQAAGTRCRRLVCAADVTARGPGPAPWAPGEDPLGLHSRMPAPPCVLTSTRESSDLSLSFLQGQ